MENMALKSFCPHLETPGSSSPAVRHLCNEDRIDAARTCIHFTLSGHAVIHHNCQDMKFTLPGQYTYSTYTIRSYRYTIRSVLQLPGQELYTGYQDRDQIFYTIRSGQLFISIFIDELTCVPEQVGNASMTTHPHSQHMATLELTCAHGNNKCIITMETFA